MSSVTVLAFDYGLKSIGVAVGQSMTGTATMLKALKLRMVSQTGISSKL